MVVAETPRPRADGAERVAVDYEPLPAVAAALDAVAPARRSSGTSSATNVCVDADAGDAAATDGGVRARRARRAPRHLGAARDRRADGAARRRRRLRRGDAALHALCRLGGVVAPRRRARRRPRRAGERGARRSRATSAATSAPATPSIRSSRWSPGRRGASAGRSSGPASGARLPQRLPGPRPRGRRRAGARRRRARSWRCAAATPATSAPTPCRSSRSAKGVGGVDQRLSHARRVRSAAARC